MEPSTWISLGALLIAALSGIYGQRNQRRTGDLAEEDQQYRQMKDANEALERRVTDLERRLGVAEDKVDACERRDAKHVQQRDQLWTFIIRQGLTPPPGARS